MCYSIYIQLVFCFFSSRRRHTRYWRDWSSDVCSSDLAFLPCRGPALRGVGGVRGPADDWFESPFIVNLGIVAAVFLAAFIRSEERRVGKKCRSRWSPYH